MSESSVQRHRMPIPKDSEGRLAYGSGPVTVIMRNGKLLKEPEVIPCKFEDVPLSYWDLNKRKKK